jgi:ribosomal protein S12 methylthiotransferase accessory factor
MIHAEGHDIYVADYTHLGVYACRIIIPGMSEIYPVDDLEYENNSLGNEIREAILFLPELDDEECQDLLDTLNGSGLADQRPVAALIGLAPDAGSLWEDLRVGELKTLLALAIGDEEATREGCDWIHHFAQINADRRRIYRCVESLLKLCDSGEYEPYRNALEKLYGTTALSMAEALLAREQRFFGLEAAGLDLNGCAMHHSLLEAYAKVQRQHPPEN